MDELTSWIISLVPDDVLQENGVALYSGRQAWDPETSNGVYVMGMNPGGSEESHNDVPIATQIAQCMGDLRYSSYTADEGGWSKGKGKGDWPRGQAPFQRSLQHLAHAMGIDLRATPATNSVFVRSSTWAELATPDGRQEACWPFHADMMDWLSTKVLILVGSPHFALKKLGIEDRHRIDRFDGPWKSNAYIAPSGMLVLHLAHPSRHHFWYEAKHDPTPMVMRALRRSGILIPT